MAESSPEKQTSVFLSYNSLDKRPAARIRKELESRQIRVLIDREHIRVGKFVVGEIERLIAESDAMIVLLGPHGYGPYQQWEQEFGQSREIKRSSYSVIPVLLPGGEEHDDFLGARSRIDLSDEATRQQELDRLLKSLRSLRGEGQIDDAGIDGDEVCPFRGLDYFREEDARFLSGREEFCDILLETINRRPVLAVTGASGSGKSSVVRAGLIPLLRNQESATWLIVTMIPGADPMQSLAAQLLDPLNIRVADDLERLNKRDELCKRLVMKNGLTDVCKPLPERCARQLQVLLFVDQWEELYTLASDEDRRSFVDQVTAAVGASAIRLVITIRGDFLDSLSAHPELAERLVDSTRILGPMSRSDMKQAMLEPATAVGLTYEDGMVERVLDEIGGEPGTLPLLGFVLASLWREREDGKLLHRSLDKMGSVRGAISRQADKALAALLDEHAIEEREARDLFLRLVHTDPDSKDTRRRARIDELDEQQLTLADSLVRQRLLVSTGDDSSVRTLEVAHEALITHWKKLRDWLDGDREFRLWKSRLRSAMHDWSGASDTNRGILLRGSPLLLAVDWLHKRRKDLSAREVSFIRQSETRQRRKRNVRWGAATVSLLALISVSIWLFLLQRQEWQRKRPIQPVMAYLPAGTFMMGAAPDDREASADEQSARPVTIESDFEIGCYEVTFDEYDRFIRHRGGLLGLRAPSDNGWGADTRPVINVSWEDARLYAEWLSERTGDRFRLPTEAEWEYAARAGTTTSRPWGADAGESCRYANVLDAGHYKLLEQDFSIPWAAHQCVDKSDYTAPVGAHEPNAFGIHDMLGNVWEWVADCWDTGAAADTHASACAFRTRRGGSWISKQSLVRVTARVRSQPDERSNRIGFRLVREVPAGAGSRGRYASQSGTCSSIEGDRAEWPGLGLRVHGPRTANAGLDRTFDPGRHERRVIPAELMQPIPLGRVFPGQNPVNPLSTRSLIASFTRRSMRPGSTSACHCIRCATSLPRTCSNTTRTSA